MHKLQPIKPEKALEMYLESREHEVSASSLQAYQYRLQHFIKFCQQEGIDNLNEVTGRTLQQYKNWRQKDGDLNATSLKSQLDSLRVFIRFCESINGVESDLSEKIISPTVGKDGAKDVKLESEKAQKILSHLSNYQYASLEHITMSLLWRTGVRLGTLRAFDLEDFDSENLWLEAIHMPESDTPLKNGKQGERLISIKPDMGQLIQEYIENIRINSMDNYGRDPLLTTENGRISKSKIRHDVYRMTCPEYVTRNKSCKSAKPWECPNAVSPHAIRRGSITHHLTKDIPLEIVSDRCNVSRDILIEHYDRRSEKIKVEQRREFLANI